MNNINTTKISRLIAETPLAEIAAESGISLRTLQRLRRDGLRVGYANMMKLAEWSRGRRLKP